MKKIDSLSIAVLVACYNRKEKTLLFLESLVSQAAFEKLQIDIYLLDDGSTDGTTDAVNKKHPFVKILAGNGHLWWVGAMVMLWSHAIAQKAYDLFLLVNDDIILFDNALENFIRHYIQSNTDGLILIGSMKDKDSNEWSYGGHILRDIKHFQFYSVRPNDAEFIPCHLGHANFFLVDAATVKKIGIFSDAYDHKFADYDYSLTAYKAGLSVLIAPGYYGWCENDHGNNWLSGNHSLKKRIEYLYKPNGLAYGEFLHFMKKHFPADYFGAIFKPWMKTFFPFIWERFKKKHSVENSIIK